MVKYATWYCWARITTLLRINIYYISLQQAPICARVRKLFNCGIYNYTYNKVKYRSRNYREYETPNQWLVNHIPLSGLCLCLQGECEELERQVDARCDALIRSIERRRQWLIDAVRQDKEIKQRSLKDHVTSCTCKLQKTTSLLQFCIEALKENDPVSFLQVSNHVISIFLLADAVELVNFQLNNRPVS